MAILVHCESGEWKLGIAALTKELGAIGMAYFIRQFDMGSGDYTAERDELLMGATIDDVLADIRKLKEERQGISIP